MTKKKTGLDALDAFTQSDKGEDKPGVYNPDLGRTNPANKDAIMHCSVYLQRAIHKRVRRITFEEDIDFSELVEGLLVEWLKKRGA